MIKILIVDDHKILIEGIVALLSTQKNLKIAGAVLNGREAVSFCNNNNVDLIIMDINMPEMNGVEASRAILNKNPNQKILVLTSNSDEQMIQRLYSYGVKGYLSKSNAGDNIIKAINIISNGSYFADETALKCLINFIKGSDLQNQKLFSERELKVIKLLVNEYSSKAIAEELLISIRTVENDKKSIMNKIGVKNTIGIVMYALKEKLYS